MKTENWPTWLTEILLALTLLSRLPLPRLAPDAFAKGARAVWAYPLVGLVLGGLAGTVGSLMILLGLPGSLAAGGVIATLVLLSGAMHEDGLADTADGFWGGFDREKRLAIMKDSQIGTYGVLALLIVTGTRWSAYTVLIPSGVFVVIAVAAVSRAAMPCLMTTLPPARAAGLSRSVGRPSLLRASVALALATVTALLTLGPAGLICVLVVLVVTGLVGSCARAYIGGQTGDVLGATQQLCEAAVLISLLMLTA